MRQYYLRTGGEVGDLQVNLVDRSQRRRKSHEVAQAVRPALEAIARRHGADLKVVEVPPGPPVLSPIVAELYGPDAEATMALAKQVRQVFETTADITAVDDTVLDPAERIVLRIDTAKAAQYGIAASDIARIARIALASEDITPLHDGASKYAVPVRIGLDCSSSRCVAPTACAMPPPGCPTKSPCRNCCDRRPCRASGSITARTCSRWST